MQVYRLRAELGWSELLAKNNRFAPALTSKLLRNLLTKVRNIYHFFGMELILRVGVAGAWRGGVPGMRGAGMERAGGVFRDCSLLTG